MVRKIFSNFYPIFGTVPSPSIPMVCTAYRTSLNRFFDIMDHGHIHEQFLSKWMDTDENMDEKLQEKLMKFRSPLYEENI